MTDARREELLSQLEELFLRDGFEALKMDDIAKRLRCSKTSLYALARSREQLVVVVTKRFFKGATEIIEKQVTEESEPSLRVRTYLTGVGTAMRRQSIAFYHDMVNFEPTADIYRRNSRAAARRVRELIQDGERDGAFRNVHGAFAAQLVTLAIEGIQSGALLDSTAMTASDAFTELGDLLMHGLAAR
jgi:AcrR family transcriptional regulator